MHSSILSLVVMAAFHGAYAAPQASGCATPTTTLTTTKNHFVCLPACLNPTSSCSAGEPTGPTPRPPVTTTVVEPSACTATVEVLDNPGCGNCPTCTSAALAARETTLPGEHWCPTPTTVSTTISPQTTEICACPKIPATCSDGGSLTTAPLPTSTLTEGCTVSVIAGPGDCSNACPTCAYPARATSFPGEKWCPTPTTVSTTIRPTKACACPLALTSCKSGEPTVKPLPTSTLTEGCTVSVIAGPGNCANFCPTCHY